jgi:hypothetical protein
MAKDTKNINIEVSIECWKKLKIISISKDVTLQEVVKDILERSVSKKNNLEEIKLQEG